MNIRTLGVAFLSFMSLGLLAVAPAWADEYKVDPVHSMVVFRIQHLGISFVYGRFTAPTGMISFDPAAPEKATFDVQVESKNVDTNTEQRDNHLRSHDFFDVAKFPTIHFKSTAVKKTGDNTYEVTGDMSLHGVTKSITITLTNVGSTKDPWGGFRTGFESTFTVKRSDYGMTFMIPDVGDEVRLMVNMEAIKQ